MTIELLSVAGSTNMEIRDAFQYLYPNKICCCDILNENCHDRYLCLILTDRIMSSVLFFLWKSGRYFILRFVLSAVREIDSNNVVTFKEIFTGR